MTELCRDLTSRDCDYTELCRDLKEQYNIPLHYNQNQYVSNNNAKFCSCVLIFNLCIFQTISNLMEKLNEIRSEHQRTSDKMEAERNLKLDHLSNVKV